MFNNHFYKPIRSLISIVLIASMFVCLEISASAKESSFDLSGKVYAFEDKDSRYEFSSSSASTESALGKLTLSGDAKPSGTKSSFDKYVVNSGNISINYTFNPSILNRSETSWCITEDKSKTVDSITLAENILNGAVIVQSSIDSKTWITDVTLTDVFKADTVLKDSVYTTSDIQLQNGCYYRIIVAYELKAKAENTQIWFVSLDNYNYKKIVEVYQFYAESSEISSVSKATDTPRKTIGTKINTGKDNGYSGNVAIDKDDPHYGWDIGQFFINGYTRDAVASDGTIVFLKNVGDKVTLWFTLKQDINCLNGDEKLTISEDNNGYDQHFEVKQTNFKRGTLIIQYTDSEGNPQQPIIYTDYLAANTRTGADTKVQLFEEGDYEVSLNYEIKKTPIEVASISVTPSYTNYKITFKFSIRNGNCMVYPFDTSSGSELADYAITPNGFQLDMAKSKYLTIDVQKLVLNAKADGTLTSDERFNRPAKDGETYNSAGIYIFTVKNLYTGESTTKTIFVGSDKYLRAMSKYGLTLDALNAQILEGHEIASDGTMTAPPEPEPEPEPEPAADPEPKSTAAPEPESEPEEATAVPTETVTEQPTVAKEPEKEIAAVKEDADDAEEAKSSDNGSSSIVYVLVVGAAVAVGGGVFLKVKRKKPSVKQR